MLNDRQRRFVQEYLKNPSNQARAAIKAGYSKKTAHVQACVLLKNPKIQAEFDRLRDRAQTKAIMEYQEACEILTAIARSNVSDYIGKRSGKIELHAGDPRALLEAVQRQDGRRNPILKFKLNSKVGAIERLAKLKGWDAPERHETKTVITVRDPEGWGDGHCEEPPAEDDLPAEA